MTVAPKLALLFLCGGAAAAQHVVGARAGTIHLAVGQVAVDGRPVHTSPTEFPFLKDGQTLQTGNGRVEILLASGVFLRAGERSALRMLSTRLDETQVELLQGTALVEVVETTKGDRIEIRYGGAVTEFRRMGLYRFDLGENTLRVFGGEADVRLGDRMVKAGRGDAVRLENPLAISKFNPKKTDELHQWAARRSFDLFASSPEAQQHRTNWEMTASGWSWNRDFQMRFYAPKVAREYQMRQARDAREEAAFQQTLDRLRAQDLQAEQQRQQQAMKQQQQQQAPPVPAPQPAPGKK